MHPKSKKKKTINTGVLDYTFTKLGDNLTNNDGYILTDIIIIIIITGFISGSKAHIEHTHTEYTNIYISNST